MIRPLQTRGSGGFAMRLAELPTPRSGRTSNQWDLGTSSATTTACHARDPENRPPTHPGALLEEFLRPLGMTQSEAARRMEIPLNRLNEVIRGRRGITADTARGSRNC